MPFSILLFFDPDTEAQIRSVWRELAESEVAPYMHRSGNRPHIKLEIFEDLDVAEAERRLKLLAAGVAPFPVDIKHFGIFPNPKPSIFLGTAVTESWLEIKSKVNQTLSDIGTFPAYEFFLPGHWVPHCLLAMELEADKLNRALPMAMRLPLPWHGQVVELGAIQFFPVKHLFGHTLG